MFSEYLFKCVSISVGELQLTTTFLSVQFLAFAATDFKTLLLIYSNEILVKSIISSNLEYIFKTVKGKMN